MPRSKRLPRAEFRAAGYRAERTPFFSLKMKTNKAGGPRIGVIVGKSVHKTAVRRNFWKRQARSVLQSLVSGERDVILIMQPQANAMTKKKFREALAQVITKITR